MLLDLLIKFKTPIAVLTGTLALCAGSYYYGMKSVKPEIVERVEFKEKIVEKIVEVETTKKNEKTKTVTKIIEKPDGTKETIISEETESDTESTKKKDKDLSSETSEKTDPIAIFPKEKTKYSLGMTAATEVGKQMLDGPEIKYGAEFGMRVLGLPLWGTAGYQFKSRDLSVGLRYEF